MKKSNLFQTVALLVSVAFLSLEALADISLVDIRSMAGFPVDQTLPNYVAEGSQKTKLSSVGSDSMDDLMQHWVESYQTEQPKAVVQVLSRGSATAPAALIDGSADIGPMSRPMKSPEREQFLSKYGFQPTEVKTALASVVIYAGADNPIESITFEQLDAVFSASRKRAGDEKAVTWRDLGIKGSLASKPIEPLGRMDGAAISSYFRQQVLLQSDFVSTLNTTADVKSLLRAVSKNRAALAFGEAVAQVPAGVKVVSVARSPEMEAVKPTIDNIYSGSYPLTRSLNVYFVRYPSEKVDTALADFLKFVLSAEGQEIVSADGYIPLSAATVAAERAKLN